MFFVPMPFSLCYFLAHILVPKLGSFTTKYLKIEKSAKFAKYYKHNLCDLDTAIVFEIIYQLNQHIIKKVRPFSEIIQVQIKKVERPKLKISSLMIMNIFRFQIWLTVFTLGVSLEFCLDVWRCLGLNENNFLNFFLNSVMHLYLHCKRLLGFGSPKKAFKFVWMSVF